MACLDFAPASALFVLSSYDHTRSVAPSTLIAICLMGTLPLNIARVRALLLFDHYSSTKSIAAVSATSVVVKQDILLSKQKVTAHFDIFLLRP
jgi:hypothetical protein